MDNMNIYKQLENTPKEAQKTIDAGRLKGFTDINPMWRIQRLTEVFGPCGIGWWTVPVDKHIEEGADGEKRAFISINLFYVDAESGEVSKAVYGEGGSSFVSKESKGYYTNDECFKMAYTDALGSCCKNLGMSADIYFSNARSKYNQVKEPEAMPNNKLQALVNLAKQKGVTVVQLQNRYAKNILGFSDDEIAEAMVGLKKMADK